MEQEFLFISKTHTELIAIKADTIDEGMFKNNLYNNIKKIIKNNDVDGKFKLVNLYNGTEKKYRTDNLVQLGGKNKNFDSIWKELSDYVYENITKNINNDKLNKLYHQFILIGGDYGIHNDELNNMFVNLLNSVKYNQIGGENQQPIDITNQQPKLTAPIDITNQQPIDITKQQPKLTALIDITNQQPIDITNQQPKLTAPIDITNQQPKLTAPIYITNQQPKLTAPIDITKHIDSNLLSNNINMIPLLSTSEKNINTNYSCPIQ